MSADALQASIDSLDRDGRLLALMEKLNRNHATEIESLHAELAELRDGLLALSNRIESLTRAVTVPRGGLHSVPSPPHGWATMENPYYAAVVREQNRLRGQ